MPRRKATNSFAKLVNFKILAEVMAKVNFPIIYEKNQTNACEVVVRISGYQCLQNSTKAILWLKTMWHYNRYDLKSLVNENIKLVRS